MQTIHTGNNQTSQRLVIFRPRDLLQDDFFRTIEGAKALWRRRCEEYIKCHGDQGACVVGAGIEVQLIPSRCRNPRWHRVINPCPDVTRYQGSLIWENSANEVVNFIRANGFECRFNYGRLD